MNFITSLFKRAPTAESLWNEMAASRTTKEGKINFPTSEEEQQILEKVKEFVKADPMNFLKFIDGQNGTHTLLTTSLVYQMKSVTEFLLSAGANPNFFSNFTGIQYTSDPEALMPLRLAIQNHWFDVAKTMMKTADTSLSKRTSLLTLAIQEGADAALIKMLVDKAAPEELSLIITQDHAANFISQAKAAKLLFNKFKNNLGTETPLHQAAKKASFGMVQVFQQNGHPLNPVNGTEGTPLQVATTLGHQDTVVTLIGAGASPNVQATNGNTPLHVTKDPEIIQYLIENGANPFIANAEGNMPFLQMLEDARNGTHNYDSSFEALFTSLNKELTDIQSHMQRTTFSSKLPRNERVAHAKQILSKTACEFMTDFVNASNDPAIQGTWKELGGSKYGNIVETLSKAAMVLNVFVAEKKGVESPKLQSLVSQMDNMVGSILMNDKFDGIAREVKKTSQAQEMKATLNILNNVAKSEGMTRVQNKITIYQTSLAG